MNKLITYEYSLKRLLRSINTINESEPVSLNSAFGRLLDENIVATLGNPRFANSAVDGYVLFDLADCKRGSILKVIGEIQAGGNPIKGVKGTTVRIFTGGEVPENAVAVVMQENVVVSEMSITVKENVKKRAGIRRKNEEYSPGEILIHRGKTLTAAEIAILAWEGISKVQVKREVDLSIICTGNEIANKKINNSNGPMLNVLCKEWGAKIIFNKTVKDDPQVLKRMMMEQADAGDLIVVTGGMSVGKYDYVPNIAADLGEIIFHRVNVRPGKPVLAARIGKSVLIGLPGNPASSFVCAQLFLKPTVRRLYGMTQSEWFEAKFVGKHLPESRDVFARCQISTTKAGCVAKEVGNQGSFGLLSLSKGNGLVRLQSGRQYSGGEIVKATLI